jgi:hypothetical protein
LPEVLARVRHDAVVSGAARGAMKGRAVLGLELLRRVLPAGVRGYAVAALAAVMAGIIVNALTLQHARHPSPFFAAKGRLTSIAAKNPTELEPVPPPPTSSSSMVSEPPPVAPPAPPPRPVGLGAPYESVSPPRTADPIADLIHSGGNKDSLRLAAAAQVDLVKLGYPMRIGASGADIAAALRDFEKAHGLPISTEVTPHLVKLLNAAANASGSR